jgi:low molecular weight protein-tyrosine phosphatase
MTKILFVCLGNICRSPLAEAIFNHKVNEKGLAGRLEAGSSGTSDYHIGQPPDSRMIRNANKNGIVINHFGRQLIEEDLETYDYILAMDKSNYRDILLLSNSQDHVDKISLIRQYDPAETGGEVPDPYFGGERGFQEVFNMLERSIENLIAFLQGDGIS